MKLNPGESKDVTVDIELLFLSVFNADQHAWQISCGRIHVHGGRLVANPAIARDCKSKLEYEIRGRQTAALFSFRQMRHHTLASISITGTALDLLGSVYLAYDLLGGQHGPLRLLTAPLLIPLCSDPATALD